MTTIKGDTLLTLKIILLTLLVIGFIYITYQFGDNGRWIRDHRGSSISDSEVKSIWCDNLGFPNPYKEIDDKEYCGELEVEMNCIFSNSGDYCSIKQLAEEKTK